MRTYNVGVQATASVTSLDFSNTGRLLFAGFDDFSCQGFDTLGVDSDSAVCLRTHDSRVSGVAVNAQGDALLTSSWDATLHVHSV